MGKKIRKYSKAMEVQLRSKHINPSDRIAILSLLPDFQLACDSNDLHEGLAV